MELGTLWEQGIGKLGSRVSPTDLACWVESIHPIALADGRLHAEVPSALHVDRLRPSLASEIASALSEVSGSPVELVLTVNKERSRVAPEPRASLRTAGDYTFESFVVGVARCRFASRRGVQSAVPLRRRRARQDASRDGDRE